MQLKLANCFKSLVCLCTCPEHECVNLIPSENRARRQLATIVEIDKSIQHFLTKQIETVLIMFCLFFFFQKIVVTHILIFVYVSECKIAISEKACSDEVYPKIAVDADNFPSENLV